MINQILNQLKNSIENIVNDFGNCSFEIPKEEGHGDYSCNICLKIAKRLGYKPLELANKIKDNLDLKANHLSKIEIAGPGFINFFLDEEYLSNVVFQINSLGSLYGSSEVGNNQKILLEYVSANPTGDLHIGHGRGAAYGDSLARMLKKCGYLVTREHYINDAGNQINNLVKSLYIRYKELFGFEAVLDEDCYHGVEVIEIAKIIKDEKNDYYLNNDYQDDFRDYGLKYLIKGLKEDLKKFNVTFDSWFSEKSLYNNNEVSNTLEYLIETNATYISENALWLKTTLNGDNKDRVLVKSDKTFTYILPDIAYHVNKFKRGYDHLINVLGADHHGYTPRLKAAIKFMGYDPDKLDIDILQMVRVIKDGEEIKMSKRSGKAITLNDLIDEVGYRALRYLYISKSLDTHMDLDLDLAIKKTNDNPVYYCLYAYARIASLFRVVEERGFDFKEVNEFKILTPNEYSKIVKVLLQYPSYVLECSLKRIPHKMTHYITLLAKALHGFYNDYKIISEDNFDLNEKLTLLKAVSIVLKDALNLIGVDVMERM